MSFDLYFSGTDLAIGFAFLLACYGLGDLALPFLTRTYRRIEWAIRARLPESSAESYETAEALALWRPLGTDERRAVLFILRRLNGGFVQYGALDIDGDPKDWTREAAEEFADAAIYSTIAALRVTGSEEEIEDLGSVECERHGTVPAISCDGFLCYQCQEEETLTRRLRALRASAVAAPSSEEEDASEIVAGFGTAAEWDALVNDASETIERGVDASGDRLAPYEKNGRRYYPALGTVDHTIDETSQVALSPAEWDSILSSNASTGGRALPLTPEAGEWVVYVPSFYVCEAGHATPSRKFPGECPACQAIEACGGAVLVSRSFTPEEFDRVVAAWGGGTLERSLRDRLIEAITAAEISIALFGIAYLEESASGLDVWTLSLPSGPPNVAPALFTSRNEPFPPGFFSNLCSGPALTIEDIRSMQRKLEEDVKNPRPLALSPLDVDYYPSILFAGLDPDYTAQAFADNAARLYEAESRKVLDRIHASYSDDPDHRCSDYSAQRRVSPEGAGPWRCVACDAEREASFDPASLFS